MLAEAAETLSGFDWSALPRGEAVLIVLAIALAPTLFHTVGKVTAAWIEKRSRGREVTPEAVPAASRLGERIERLEAQQEDVRERLRTHERECGEDKRELRDADRDHANAIRNLEARVNRLKHPGDS